MQHVPYWRLSAYYFAYFAFLGVFTPYFALYLHALEFSAWDIGLVMSQMQLMRIFAPYFWSWVADRCGQRLRIVRATGAVALALFAVFFVLRGFYPFLLAMAVFSVFWAASLPLVEALTFDHLRENAAHYSRVRLWGSVGFIVAVMAGGALLDHLPLVAILWASAALLVGNVVCSLYVPDAPTHQAGDAPAALGQLLRQARIRALLGASFAMAAANAALNIFYAIFLAKHGYSKSLVGGLFSLGVVSEIVAFFFMARIMRRYSLRAILMVSFACGVVRFVLIGWGVDHLAVLLLTQAMHGVTFGAFHAAAITAINRWFPGRARSRGQALYASLSVGLGGWLGGVIAGWVWDHLGDGPTFALGSLYSLIGLLLVAGWIRERPVSEKRGSCVEGRLQRRLDDPHDGTKGVG
jgi:PPP family 3-phenylpropionic acid transporter